LQSQNQNVPCGMKYWISLSLLLYSFIPANALRVAERPTPAIASYAEYLPMLNNKKIALVVNQTSSLRERHLVDILIDSGINIVKIFTPEHGFRGTDDAGKKVNNTIDEQTQLPLISLYGDNKKPKPADMSNVDIVLFDIQDVGVRFYTYISTLQYVMEACAENKKQLIVLDRPNPNGHYIDGPVLEIKNKSFVGMQAIPIVYGMTIGEYATMLNGEKLLNNKVQCNLQVIKCINYTHNSAYILPVPPSPNLKSGNAIALYPALCLFEGTEVSVGRGTKTPFEIWGHPTYKDNGFSFTPTATVGNANPLYANQQCFGGNLNLPYYKVKDLMNNKINLTWLKNAYFLSPNKTKFFNPFFTKLAGNTTLQKQIVKGMSEAEIRTTWMPAIAKFKKVRKKYLLYPDFE
jgi:uncharacterized protein YbbC (DUF1343 family)